MKTCGWIEEGGTGRDTQGHYYYPNRKKKYRRRRNIFVHHFPFFHHRRLLLLPSLPVSLSVSIWTSVPERHSNAIERIDRTFSLA
jgi:hypothetical protein